MDQYIFENVEYKTYSENDSYCSYRYYQEEDDYKVYLFNQRYQCMSENNWYKKYFLNVFTD
jgi:hypothetical protein